MLHFSWVFSWDVLYYWSYSWLVVISNHVNYVIAKIKMTNHVTTVSLSHHSWRTNILCFLITLFLGDQQFTVWLFFNNQLRFWFTLRHRAWIWFALSYNGAWICFGGLPLLYFFCARLRRNLTQINFAFFLFLFFTHSAPFNFLFFSEFKCCLKLWLLFFSYDIFMVWMQEFFRNSLRNNRHFFYLIRI